MTKIHKDIIPYKEGWLVVDKKAIVPKNYVGTLYQNGELYASGQASISHTSKIVGNGRSEYGKEWNIVISSIGIRIEGVPLIEKINANVDFQKLGNDFINQLGWVSKGNLEISNSIQTAINAVEYGYKANTKQYTEANIRSAVKLGLSISTLTGEPFTSKAFKSLESSSVDAFLKSLQKAPISVELEYEHNCEFPDCINEDHSVLKITSPETNTIIPINIEYAN